MIKGCSSDPSINYTAAYPGRRAAWTGLQSVTGPTHNRDKQPLLLAFTLTGKLESPINLMSMWEEAGEPGEKAARSGRTRKHAPAQHEAKHSLTMTFVC